MVVRGDDVIFIVATHSFLLEVELDSTWRVKRYEVLRREHHYGIAIVNNSRVFAIKRGDNQLDLPQLTEYDVQPSLVLRRTRLFGEHFDDVHQISNANNGLYIANTGYNSLFFTSTDGQVEHRHMFGNIIEDVNHVNSVYPCGNQVFALLHNRSRTDGEITVLHHDLTSGFSLVQQLSLSHRRVHNIFIDGRHLCYKISPTGEFVVVDLVKERISKTLSLPGHTKGLSVMQDYYVIGFSDRASRDERFTSKGHLAIVDRRTWNQIATVDLNFASLRFPILLATSMKYPVSRKKSQVKQPLTLFTLASLPYVFQAGTLCMKLEEDMRS